MKIYVCIDDTDNIDSIGTGTVADYIKAEISRDLGLRCSSTTRHQLLIHEDIPYTSHNSSMCFTVDLCESVKTHSETYVLSQVKRIKEIAIKTVCENRASGSDPGICVVLNPNDEAQLKLIQFGMEAKSLIKTKAEAYALARRLEIHLSEHGGTGGGVIGAMAGVGLRLSGEDGEVKASLKSLDRGIYRVEELMQLDEVDVVRHIETMEILKSGAIKFESKSKTLLRNNQFTLFVAGAEAHYKALDKKQIRRMETRQKGNQAEKEHCKHYSKDVDEECIDDQEVCANCSYRRWTEDAFKCLLSKD